MSFIEVKTKKHWKDFLRVPQAIYTDPKTRYVYPLNLHMEMMVGKIGKPEKHLFVGYKDGVPVARVGFKVHRHGKKENLNFGFFECREDCFDIVNEMIQKGISLYPKLDVIGPFHFRMEDPYVGILAEGFELDPYFLMPYNPPYYNDFLTRAGFSKAMDLFTYQIDADTAVKNSPVIKENSIKALEKGVSVRFLNPKKLNDEARTIAGIFNDALSRNWGFEEFLDEQVKEMVMMFRLFIDHRVVAIAQVGGKDVGCLLMIPNYNSLLKKSNRGSLSPSFIWNYLTKKRSIHEIRGYALGVLKDYHSMGVGSALTQAMFEQGPKCGYPDCEISWILANNGPMNELSKAMGSKHNKVYKIYEIKRASK